MQRPAALPQQRKVQAVPEKSYVERWPHCNLEDDKAVTQAPATSFQQQPNDIQQYTKSSDEAVAAMTATTATQTKTDGQCANGADTVRMTPAATPVVQTALALKSSVTTMRKDCTALQRSEQQSCATMQGLLEKKNGTTTKWRDHSSTPAQQCA